MPELSEIACMKENVPIRNTRKGDCVSVRICMCKRKSVRQYKVPLSASISSPEMQTNLVCPSGLGEPGNAKDTVRTIWCSFILSHATVGSSEQGCTLASTPVSISRTVQTKS